MSQSQHNPASRIKNVSSIRGDDTSTTSTLPGQCETAYTGHYQCPICLSSLVKESSSLVCKQNHRFDFAKEGYVNLLPVQLKKSLQPGDDKNMVIARRAFLEAGFYGFLQRALINEIDASQPNTILDLGCGEGYYTNEIQKQINALTYGVDISKSAVKYASKRNKSVHYSVATNAHLPLPDESIEIIANVFAPLVGKECERVLTSKGRIISVSPGPYHLQELKSVIYDTPELHSTPTPPEGFDAEKQTNISEQIQLATANDVDNLLTMTPFGWKISKENKATLMQRLPFTVQLDFVITHFVVARA